MAGRNGRTDRHVMGKQATAIICRLPGGRPLTKTHMGWEKTPGGDVTLGFMLPFGNHVLPVLPEIDRMQLGALSCATNHLTAYK